MKTIKRIHNQETMTNRLKLGYSLTYLEKEEFSREELLKTVLEYMEDAKINKITKESLVFCLHHLPDSYQSVDIMKMITYGEITYNELPKNLQSSTDLSFMAGYYKPDEIIHRKDVFLDKDYAFELLVKDVSLYKHIPKHFKNDKNFIMNCLKKSPLLFPILPYEYRNDVDCVALTLERNYLSYETTHHIWQRVSSKLKNNKELVFNIVTTNPKLYQFLPQDIKDNFSIALRAVTSDPMNLQFAPDTIKNSKEICEMACKNNFMSFEFVGKQLKNEPEFIVSIIEINPYIIKELSEEIKGNPSVAKVALKTKCFSVRSEENVFSYFSEDIRNNIYLANIAIDTYAHAAKFLGHKLINSNDFFIQYVNRKDFNENVILYSPESLKTNKDYLLTFIKKNIDCVHYLPEQFLHDKQFIDQLIQIVDDKYEQAQQRSQYRYLLSILDFKEDQKEQLFYFLKNTMENEYKDDPEYFNKTIYSCLNDHYKNLIKNENINIYDYLNKYMLSQKLDSDLENKKQSAKRKI